MRDEQTKHTEGPWRPDGPDMFGDYNILHPADSLAIGAIVSNMRPEAEVLANARLTAAAPDLLAFVKLYASDDPVFAKGYEKQRIAEARALVSLVES